MNSPHTTSPSAGGRRRAAAAFTLVEVMVSMAVLSILLLISAQVIGQVQTTWASSTARISQFREARVAFDILTRNLSQAVLNTFIDYDSNYLSDEAAVMTAAPTTYQKFSDLQFKCGPAPLLLPGAGGEAVVPGHAIFFQAPLGVVHDPEFAGLDRLLCGRGYFVQFTSDEFFRPGFLPPGNARYRYRLMEFSPPAEQNQIYSAPAAWYAGAGAAFAAGETPAALNLTRPVADNILTLIIAPQTGADDYAYDSRAAGPNQHVLPPLVRVVLVAIDERSAERLAGFDETGTPPFGDELSNFQTPGQLDGVGGDLDTLETALRAQKINYRVFSSTIALRTAQ